ncbi:MAG: hypothetical protein HOM58_12950 [Rhodospirillaceae bacterium]|nr:hypothetical protein [Rhodospirillaceae bacterium]
MTAPICRFSAPTLVPDVLQEQERPKRVSILIGADGKVAKTYRVEDAPSHPALVLHDII